MIQTGSSLLIFFSWALTWGQALIIALLILKVLFLKQEILELREQIKVHLPDIRMWNEMRKQIIKAGQAAATYRAVSNSVLTKEQAEAIAEQLNRSINPKDPGVI